MKGEAQGILAVATSIADGQDVDWPAIEAGLRSEEERALVRSLRVIASIGELHRSTDPDPDGDPDPPIPASTATVIASASEAACPGKASASVVDASSDASVHPAPRLERVPPAGRPWLLARLMPRWSRRSPRPASTLHPPAPPPGQIQYAVPPRRRAPSSGSSGARTSRARTLGVARGPRARRRRRVRRGVSRVRRAVAARSRPETAARRLAIVGSAGREGAERRPPAGAAAASERGAGARRRSARRSRRPVDGIRARLHARTAARSPGPVRRARSRADRPGPVPRARRRSRRGPRASRRQSAERDARRRRTRRPHGLRHGCAGA